MAVFIGSTNKGFVVNAFYKTKSKDDTGTLYQFIQEMPDGSNAFYVHFRNRKTGSYERPRVFIFEKGQGNDLVRTKKSKK